MQPLAVLTRLWVAFWTLENGKKEQINNQINTEKGARNASGCWCHPFLFFENKIVDWARVAYSCSLYFPLVSDVLSTRVCSVNLISYVDNVVENVEVTNYGNIFSENPPNCCTLSRSAQWTCQAALWEAICKCINYAMVSSDLDQPVTINHCVYCHYCRNDWRLNGRTEKNCDFMYILPTHQRFFVTLTTRARVDLCRY